VTSCLVLILFACEVKIHRLSELICNFKEENFVFQMYSERYDSCFWIFFLILVLHGLNLVLIRLAGIQFPFQGKKDVELSGVISMVQVQTQKEGQSLLKDLGERKEVVELDLFRCLIDCRGFWVFQQSDPLRQVTLPVLIKPQPVPRKGYPSLASPILIRNHLNTTSAVSVANLMALCCQAPVMPSIL
ncbi:hypothetical protein GOODEAATRI_025076, partial [Goodea atripinnis]